MGASAGRIRAILSGLLGGPDATATFLDQAQAALNGIIDNDVITRLQKEINQPLEEFTTGAHPQQAGFQVTDPNLASIARTLQMMRDDAPGILGPLTSSGLGYANALYIATILAELRALKDTDLTVLLVEEPEAHLHPHLQTPPVATPPLIHTGHQTIRIHLVSSERWLIGMGWFVVGCGVRLRSWWWWRSWCRCRCRGRRLRC